ncbi:hypothetical protein [Streptomyces melanosporofaciens]|uniref:Uncharacterized protein n=1 Tax=Streptomyces melanosporofaciens TaxID=67327 RepID=A0A1H4KS92_STRMJ|nr:hypothetical protein [Streptomyces melanosporofaciens]SEB60968.1 hypothetical protein SAMN04490356_0915 [Streptomyces melanosporofaciens]
MSGDNRTERGAWVVLGGIHLLNQTAPRRPDEPIVLIRVAPQEVCLPSITVAIRWKALGVCPVDALSSDGMRLGAALIDGSILFPDAIAGAALRRLVGADAAPRLVPLCYLAEHPGGGYHAYAQIRFYPDDACFVRTTREPVGHGPVTALRWLGPVLSAHAESSMALNNHLRYFRTHFAGTELEYKYTLDPAPDIWAASLELLKVLRDGEPEGCRPEYREEFQIHHTENHLFDVVGPEQEIGYASFIPTVSAGYVLKRKWFVKDTFARREELASGVDVAPDGFEEYLCTELGLQVRAMPPFQRVRYDVQCESMRTGHVYGIFFDRCSLLAAPEMVLSQCELEYRRSRSVLDHDQDEVLGEMERIDSWLRSYLAAHGWAKQHTFYSKRSFLRDAVTARPELQSLVTACHGRLPPQ